MALIETTRDGRPLYRVRWNYRRHPETGRKEWDQKEFRDEAKARKFDAERTAVTTNATDRITVGELVTAWRLAHHPDHATGRTKAWQLRTRKDRDQQCGIRIVPFLGRDRVAALTPQRVEEWIDWMLAPVAALDDDGKATKAPRFGGRVANKALQDLKAALRWGRGKGLVENVFINDVAGIPAAAPKPPHPRTPSEVRQIMDGCRVLRDATLICVAAYSGLRWSELRGLQWGDVSIDMRTIHVQRSIDLDRSIKLPKNGKTRTTVLLKRGRDALGEYRDALPPRPADAWVFPNRDGNTLTAEWYRDRLPEIRKACGIDFDLHEMRDTYASLLIATKEITVEELTLWLGHSSVQLTLRRYARLYEQLKAPIADAADRLIESMG